MRNIDKIILLTAMLVFILIITSATIIKIKTNEINREYDYLVSSFVHYAVVCKEEKKCLNENVTLKELYDNDYIDKKINPKTDEYFNENSYVNISKKEFVLKKEASKN